MMLFLLAAAAELACMPSTALLPCCPQCSPHGLPVQKRLAGVRPVAHNPRLPPLGLHAQERPAAHSLKVFACRLTFCLPRNVQLEYALLLYFDKRYEEAWTELGCVLQVGGRGTGAAWG